MKKQFEIFWQFFVLGWISFGGPMAHLGYFRKQFVEKLAWLSDESYAKIVALSNFLPGPSSSQVGFSIGLLRGGKLGAILAFIAFTFPSFLLLYLAVTIGSNYTENSVVNGVINGLKLFAVVIVADATLGMYKKFCIDKVTKLVFIISTIVLVFFQSFVVQIVVLLVAGVIGSLFLKKQEQKELEYIKPKFGYLVVFFGLLFIVPFFIGNELVTLFNSFYQAGALVFGGGHIVLPLLSNTVDVVKEEFLIGYSLAQAVPGPMFTIASYLGAVGYETSPFLGALVAIIAVFLPGFLLILAFNKSFESYSKNTKIANGIKLINASVVGILLSVLLTPIIPSGIGSITDIFVVLIGLYILRKFKVSIFLLILVFSVYGVLNV